MDKIVCVYSNNFIMGGIESYFARMLKWAVLNNKEAILILAEGSEIHLNWEKDFLNFNIQILYYKKNIYQHYLIDKQGKKFDLSFDCNYHIITADISSYLKMILIRKEAGLKKCTILMYILHNSFCYVSKKKWLNLPFKRLYRLLYFKQGMLFMDEETLLCFSDIYQLKEQYNKIFRLGLFIDEYQEELICNLEKQKKNDFNILTVTRMDFPFKGYVMGLVDVFEKIHNNYPFLSLTIIGDGPGKQVLKDRINTMSKEVQNAINLLPEIPYDEMDIYLSKTNLFVGMGTTVLDAAKMGIVSAVCKAYSYKAMTPGFLAEAYNNLSGTEKVSGSSLVGIEKKIEEMIDMSKEHFLELSKECYNVVHEYYNIDTNMREIMNIREEVTISDMYLYTALVCDKIIKKIQKIFK